jgi:molybdenum cofactor cytidylyltransferase
MTRVAAIVLAAGASERFGGDKLMAPLTGSTVAARLIALLDVHPAIASLTVVVPPDRALSMLAPGTRRAIGVTNHAPHNGQSSSFRVGLDATPSSALGALLFLADCPGIGETTLLDFVTFVLEAPDSIARPVVGEVPGHPVWTPRRLFADVPPAGDAGLRELIKARAEPVRRWPTDDRGCILDADDPARLAELTAWLESR